MEKQSKIRGFLKNEQGSVIITFALLLNTLILAVALSLDLGRAYMASSAISGAADAAAVASAVNEGDAAKAQEYFEANLPVGTLGITYNYATDVTHVVDTATNSVSVDTSGFEVPAFLSAGNTSNAAVAVGGGVTVGLPSAAFLPADYFFIIDSSGSMSGSSGSGGTKAQAVGTAINNFLDIVFQNQGVDSNGISNYRVSLTNYRAGYSLSNPLNDDKATIISQLNPMLSPGGLTCGGCGLRDSKDRLLEEILTGNSNDRQRVIIFMTDGQLNRAIDYMPANHPLPPSYDGNTSPNNFGANGPYAMAAKECYSMQNLSITDSSGSLYEHMPRSGNNVAVAIAQNVSIWTIRFGSGANGGQNLAIMNYCASNIDQSLFAQTGNDLDQVFSQIGISTSRTRITR